MTDVMTVGIYPESPLPGPRFVPAYDVVHDTWNWHLINRLPPEPKNPILEEPAFFPGAAWKGTSGMPQYRHA
jgi:hypothetical protein